MRATNARRHPFLCSEKQLSDSGTGAGYQAQCFRGSGNPLEGRSGPYSWGDGSYVDKEQPMEHQIKDRPFIRAMKQWRTAGFTFMEVLIVLLLLSIVVMLGWPALNTGMGDFRLSAAAEEAVTALEFAQLTATSGQKIQVTIDSAADKIEVKKYKVSVDLFDGSSQYSEAGVEGGSFIYAGNPMNKGTDYMITLADDSRFRGVIITASDLGAGNEVTFNSIGTPSKGGTVTLTLGNRQMVVTLDAVSAKVTVSE